MYPIHYRTFSSIILFYYYYTIILLPTQLLSHTYIYIYFPRSFPFSLFNSQFFIILQKLTYHSSLLISSVSNFSLYNLAHSNFQFPNSTRQTECKQTFFQPAFAALAMFTSIVKLRYVNVTNSNTRYLTLLNT